MPVSCADIEYRCPALGKNAKQVGGSRPFEFGCAVFLKISHFPVLSELAASHLPRLGGFTKPDRLQCSRSRPVTFRIHIPCLISPWRHVENQERLFKAIRSQTCAIPHSISERIRLSSAAAWRLASKLSANHWLGLTGRPSSLAIKLSKRCSISCWVSSG